MLLSASQSATRRTPFIFLKALMWLSPRLRMPITATRISSLAPATCDHDRAGQLKAPAATREFLRNVRRVNGFIGLMRLFSFIARLLRNFFGHDIRLAVIAREERVGLAVAAERLGLWIHFESDAKGELIFDYVNPISFEVSGRAVEGFRGASVSCNGFAGFVRPVLMANAVGNI